MKTKSNHRQNNTPHLGTIYLVSCKAHFGQSTSVCISSLPSAQFLTPSQKFLMGILSPLLHTKVD